jgi:hypothetical protein
MMRFHLPDGPAQQARDATMRPAPPTGLNEAIGWLYSHDASVLPNPAPAPH